jgi:hypothetical protein
MDTLIFQIYYQQEQTSCLDNEFIPYNNECDSDPLLEFNVFRKIIRSGVVDGCLLWGAVSWKFHQKTGVYGKELKKFITDNSGYDVYYCNPHVHLEAIFPNLWLQGETAHPEFLNLSREIFRVADIPEKWLTAVYPARAFASANYLIATPAFWFAYIDYVESILEKVRVGLSGEWLALLFSNAADYRNLHAGASYLPFIVERLFMAFMLGSGRSFRSLKYPLPKQEAKLDHHQQLLRQMKDVACKGKSLWMLACWVNYRNLYLATRYPLSWIERYLPMLTPDPVEFIEFFDDFNVADSSRKS